MGHWTMDVGYCKPVNVLGTPLSSIQASRRSALLLPEFYVLVCQRCQIVHH